MLPGGRILGVDGAGKSAEPQQGLRALKPFGALLGRQLVDHRGVVDPALIAAVRLAPVKGAVGEMQQLARVVCDAGIADACGQGDAVGLMRRRGDHASRPLDRDQRLLASGLGQDPGELVATGAAQGVLGARQAAQAARDADQHRVSRLVAAHIVGLLEVVDVDQCDRDRLGVTNRTGHLGGEALLERAMIGESGQWIGRGLRGELRAVLDARNGRGEEIAEFEQSLLVIGAQFGGLGRGRRENAP